MSVIKKIRKLNKGVQAAIDKVDTTYALAKKCRVSQPAVMKWLHENCPVERAIQLEKITGVCRSKIRPDIFGGSK